MAKKKETASVVDTDRYKYDTIKIRGKDGKVHTSKGNGDAVARAMLVHIVGAGGDIQTVVNSNKLQDDFKAHAKKNLGMQRMTLGHMLRALVKAGTAVKIGKEVITKLTQKVDIPKVEYKTPGAGVKKAAKKAKKAAAKPRKRAPEGKAGEARPE